MDLELLDSTLTDLGQPPFRAKQVWEWTARGTASYEAMTNLPAAVRSELTDRVPFSTLEVTNEAHSKDGTIKALFSTRKDSRPVEAVLMRYRDGRRSLCLSSQSGCPLTCTFCATGTMKFGRNLTVSEILDQALHFRRIEEVDHVVFMGMGEPMMNLDNVLEACRRLPDVGVSHRRTAISTVGWKPGIEALTENDMPIRLALSLHAADESLRSQIMPVNDRYPLSEVLAACDRFYDVKKRMIFIEYVMLKGVNDSYTQAVQLADVLDPKKYKINLIPYNPTGTYDGSGREAIGAFKAALEEHGIGATVRLTRGQDIDAAGAGLARLSGMPALTLDALHREARELERAHRRGDPEALARVAPFRPDAAKPLKDAGALLVIARERGFPTWVKLQSYVERLDLGGEGLEHAFHTDMEYYEGRADGLLASAQDRTPSAAAAFEGERVEMTPAGARVVVAQRHGFASWSALRRHVEGLAESGEPFAHAYRALEERRHDDLAALLGQFPELATARGTNGNALINMASDAETLRVLLDAGADVAHPNAHGWTPLHQAAYSNRGDLAQLLLEAGAPADVPARGAGGTPLIVALFWGHREVVDDVLLAAGRHPSNLRVAAGIGDVETIGEMVSADGIVSEAAGALRGFYRPHGGFPAWSPADDPQEIVDEALSWAARADRVEALWLLVERGARVDADVYRGTALTWAAANGRVAAIAALVELGADVNARGTFGGPTHGEGVTALHIAAQAGQTAAVEVLLAAGADPTLRDALYDGPASGWAAQGGHTALAALLRQREG